MLGKIGSVGFAGVIGIAASLLVGCTNSPADTDNTDTVTGPPEGATLYYRDVKPILDAKCNGCHNAGGIGPFSLETFEDAKPLVGLIKDEVVAKRMPPWPANESCNDYWGDRSLTDEQIATITKWVDDGAFEGNVEDEGKKLTSNEKVQLSRVDLTLKAPEPYVQKMEPDDYRCFVIDWPYEDVKYVSGFRANPGDGRVVHHVIAFLVAPNDVPTIEAMDAAEEGPGYTCFGGSGINSNEWLGAWAPGSQGSDFPLGTGVRVEPGSKIAIQVHYNSLTAGPQPDQTSIDFKIEDTVEKEGRIQPWTKLAWLSGDSMMIPAGETDVKHTFEYDPTVVLTGGQPFTMYSASLHMHELGTSGKFSIKRKDAPEECLLQIDDWNFHWQGSYGLKKPTVFNPGDKLYLECHWDNSAGNQTGAPKDTWWGEGTGDEMCLGAFYMTE